jgi:hypothetical protein
MPDEPSAPRRFQSVIAAILACLVAIAATALLELMTQGTPHWYRADEALANMAESVARPIADTLGVQVSSGFIVTYDQTWVVINTIGLFGPLDRLILLHIVAFAATIAACRVWGFGPKRTCALVAFSGLLTAPLALLLSGTFVGLALGLCPNTESASTVRYLARDAALVLTCAIVGFTWWLAAWLGDDEPAQPLTTPQHHPTLLTSFFAAAAAAIFLAILRLFSALGAIFVLASHGPQSGVTISLPLRWAISALLFLASAAMLLWAALRPSRLARWAWLPALATAPLGGNIGTAVPLLAAIVAACDERFRALRGLPLQPAAPARIARRDQQPFLLWICLLAAVLMWGAFVRYKTPMFDIYVGLSILAHPAIFAPALFAVVVLGFWDWRRHRRQTGRWLSMSALTVLLACGSAALYGFGAFHEIALRLSIAAAEPYFQRIRITLPQVPLHFGPWAGADVEPPKPAITAFPNAILSRRYADSARSLQADLQIFHCRDARDVWAYAPFIAFLEQGYSSSSSNEADWTVGTQTIHATEYTFNPLRSSSNHPIYVAFFIVTPSGRFLRDSKDLTGEPFTQGAAAVRVILPASTPSEIRRQAVTELLAAAMPAIQTIAQEH